MKRDAMVDRAFAGGEVFDLAVIGGGATGVGVALDAAVRGYRVALFEQSDFGKATSSRSTKLVHGGVRYLQQGNISLVMEALKERGLLRRNAPHLVHDLAFVVPNYDWWETPFYGIGMKVYDLLAGRYGFGGSRILSTEKVLERIPTLEREGLRGGVLYHDGQFDDARLLINLAQTAADHGAVLVNYCGVVGLTRNGGGYLDGVIVRDAETGREASVRARCVVNATGAFVDGVRRMDEPGAAGMIAPSQGVHLVLERSFLPGDAAIMVPRTRDGRVMFAIPWHGHALLGTTDTPIEEASLEPRAMDEEIDFLLETAGQYLATNPTRGDVRSVWAGVRPLVKTEGVGSTAALSREHTIHISQSGLLTITGGKWTTYRRMAADCVDHAATLANLAERPCGTKELRIHGGEAEREAGDALTVYGSDAAEIESLARSSPALAGRVHAASPVTGAQVAWAARWEMARTVDDVLARRTRTLMLDAGVAIEAAPRVAAILGEELGRDEAWRRSQVEAFTVLASGYRL